MGPPAKSRRAFPGGRLDSGEGAASLIATRTSFARLQATVARSRGRVLKSVFRLARACTGKIASVADYGAFVELETGVEGLVHVSEMSWSKRVKHPSKLVNPGDEVEVEV